MNELGELIENKNKGVENMLVVVVKLKQGLIRLEFAADEVICKHEAESRRLEVVADELACNH